MGLRPQTFCGIADSPVGLAAYFLDHNARSYELISRAFAGESVGLTRDDILDNITITWLTNTALFFARLLLGGINFLTSSIQPRGVGQSGRTPSSPITTSSIKVGTSRLGNSRNSCLRRFARASDHCGIALKTLARA
jgi:hypothetical protein